ncbi:hypothetical protein [Catenulispora rubra]|uniref:hypothetical protein n=1 Tax=Catenulispora rubra TaxID=280293 RepID=UPI00189253B6|nr:hypothetical protein [Catenulispora rubra]
MEIPPAGWRKSAIHPRRQWPREVRDFVPWLASNINQLGALLDCDLTVVARGQVMWEATAIRPDLVAQTADGDLVLIEAQLGRSDNRHLGQLLVYAAAGGFSQLVWVIADMSDVPAVDPNHARAIALLGKALTPFGITVAMVEATVETDWYPPHADPGAFEMTPRLCLVDLTSAAMPRYDYR